MVIRGLKDDASAQYTLQTCLATGVQAELIIGDLANDSDDLTLEVFVTAWMPTLPSTRW